MSPSNKKTSCTILAWDRLFSKPGRVLNDNKQARNLFLGIAHTGSITHSLKSSVMFFVPDCDVVYKVKRASIFFLFFFFFGGGAGVV